MADVFFTSMKTTPERSLPVKLEILLERSGLQDIVKKDDLTAVKIHFGEPGNLAYVNPVYARVVVRMIKKLGGKPFLTDSNTLYRGKRSNAVDHTISAIQNGFSYSVVEAPVVIADGLRGSDQIEIAIEGKRVKKAKIGSAIVLSDALVVVTHFKGHEQTGFGGTLKNVGMGSASRAGKMEQHSESQPTVKKDLCTACGMCEKYCPVSAISVEEHAEIDYSVCIGCGQCIVMCPTGAMVPVWDSSVELLMEKMVEYAHAVLKDKVGKSLFVSFVTNVSPNCDCWPNNEPVLVPDIGLLASKDPVALDQACVDLVNQAVHLRADIKEDVFRSVHPAVDWKHQLEYAEQLGLGTRKYRLIEV